MRRTVRGTCEPPGADGADGGGPIVGGAALYLAGAFDGEATGATGSAASSEGSTPPWMRRRRSR